MKKYSACVLGILLMLAPELRADTTVSDGSPATFRTAVSNAIALGGIIQVTTPIVIANSTNGPANVSFDGLTNVVVNGGSNSSLFIVKSGSLTLANFTLANGVNTNGGAIYISAGASLNLTNCTVANNTARGIDGDSAETNGADGIITGRPGGKGSPAQAGYGGAIFNLGSVTVLNCRFFTNSVFGGDGGDGGDGGNGGTRGGNGGAAGRGGDAFGAGIYNAGTLSVFDSTFSGNLAQGGLGGAGGAGGGGNISGMPGSGGLGGNAVGAGIYTLKTNAALDLTPTLTIARCTFSANTVQGGDGVTGGTTTSGTGQVGRPGGSALGAGVANAGVTGMTNSTFYENNALGGTGGTGGSGGRAGNGGAGGDAIGAGLYNAATVWVVNCTFSKGSAFGGTNGAPGSGNAAGRNGKRGRSLGGNIANVAKKKAGLFHLQNSIVAAGLSGGAASGVIVDEGYNIGADKTVKLKQKTSLKKTNPFVGDLAENGGLTETLALAPNSPAIDKIPTNFPATDQRGFVTRPQIVRTNFADIGAFEVDTNLAQIILGPQGTNIIAGSNVTFTVTASGQAPLFYQWFFQDVVISGANSNSFSITNVQPTNGGNYKVTVSNSFNTAVSAEALLNVLVISNTPPQILVQPTNRQDVTAGVTVTISVNATGAPPLMYQWFFESAQTLTTTNLIGQTNSVLTIANAQTTNSGFYAVVITNLIGGIQSSNSILVVTNASTNGDGPPFPGSARTESVSPPAHMSLVPLAVAPDGNAAPTVNFAFPSQAEVPYVIEYKKSLTDLNWTPISTNIGTGDWLTNRIPATNQPAGFYRVRSP